jgi:hypothetical protein
MHQNLSSTQLNSENTSIYKTNVLSPRKTLTSVADPDVSIEDNHEQVKKQTAQTIRVVIGWQQAEETAYFYNWDTVTVALENAEKNGVQPIWDLCYAGLPDNLTPLQPNFVRRFAAFCRAFVCYYKYKQPDAVLTVAAIDENAFVSSEIFLRTNPESVAILTQACAEAVSAMKEEDPNIYVLTSQSTANIISLLDKPRTNDVNFAIAS